MTNIQPHESAMPVRFGQERGQEGLVGVVFRTVNMAGSVHDSRCLPFALGQKGRRDEAKKGKGGGAVIRTVKSDSISWMALRSETQLLSLFTHTPRGLVAVRSLAMMTA